MASLGKALTRTIILAPLAWLIMSLSYFGKVLPFVGVRYRLTDRRIADHLATAEADVLVGTRPGLNVALARRARRGPLRVGQEHLTLDSHSRALRTQLRGAYPRLDALTTTTEAATRFTAAITTKAGTSRR